MPDDKVILPKGSAAAHHMTAMLGAADRARDLMLKSPDAMQCAAAVLSVVLHYQQYLKTQGIDPEALEPFLDAMRSSGIFSENAIEQCRASVAAHVPKQRLAAVPEGKPC